MADVFSEGCVRVAVAKLAIPKLATSSASAEHNTIRRVIIEYSLAF
jgi:hypothetical protein